MNRNETWKYQIGTGKTPVIASAIMLAIFGGLTIWLYQTKNGAFLLMGGFSGILFLLVCLTVYRLCVYKILIGKDEFFYQTNYKNGRTYRYAQVEKAWTSAGREMNGYQSEYCNIDLGAGQVLRFPFYYNDEKAIKYLLGRIEKCAGTEEKETGKSKENYRIDGKTFGKSHIAAAAVLLAVVAVLDGFLINQNIFPMQEGSVVQAGIKILLLGSGTLLMLGVLAVVILNYISFKVEIGEQGVFVQTRPWNGRYYQYSEIVSCREIEKVVRGRGLRGQRRLGRSYYYFFEFTDVWGETRKFQFEKPLFAREVNVLRERITTNA